MGPRLLPRARNFCVTSVEFSVKEGAAPTSHSQIKSIIQSSRNLTIGPKIALANLIKSIGLRAAVLPLSQNRASTGQQQFLAPIGSNNEAIHHPQSK